MGDFDNFQIYAQADGVWYACLQVDPYSMACGKCGQTYFRDQPKFCKGCGAKFAAREDREMPQDEAKRIYELNMLRDKIAAMQASGVSYPSYDKLIRDYEEAAARQREQQAFMSEPAMRERWTQFQAFTEQAARGKTDEAMYGVPPNLGPNALSEPIERINPAQQQPRKILL